MADVILVQPQTHLHEGDFGIGMCYQVVDSLGEPVNVTGYTVTLIFKNGDNDVIEVETVHHDALNGWVRYVLEDGDIAETGMFETQVRLSVENTMRVTSDKIKEIVKDSLGE